MGIPQTETARLIVREFATEDSEARRKLIEEAFGSPVSQEDNAQWMHWTLLSYREFAKLYQPPYGERAVVLKETGALIGTVGLVPSTIPWGVLQGKDDLISPEFGLFWAILNEHRGKGYAAEGARVIIDFVFDHLNARRIVATTEHENVASQRVMEKLGMVIDHNPSDSPFWFQVVGVLENPKLKG